MNILDIFYALSAAIKFLVNLNPYAFLKIIELDLAIGQLSGMFPYRKSVFGKKRLKRISKL